MELVFATGLGICLVCLNTGLLVNGGGGGGKDFEGRGGGPAGGGGGGGNNGTFAAEGNCLGLFETGGGGGGMGLEEKAGGGGGGAGEVGGGGGGLGTPGSGSGTLAVETGYLVLFETGGDEEELNLQKNTVGADGIPGSGFPEVELSCFSNGLFRTRGDGGEARLLFDDVDLDVCGEMGDEGESEVCTIDLTGESFLTGNGGGVGGRVGEDGTAMFPSNEE